MVFVSRQFREMNSVTVFRDFDGSLMEQLPISAERGGPVPLGCQGTLNPPGRHLERLIKGVGRGRQIEGLSSGVGKTKPGKG